MSYQELEILVGSEGDGVVASYEEEMHHGRIAQ